MRALWTMMIAYAAGVFAACAAASEQHSWPLLFAGMLAMVVSGSMAGGIDYKLRSLET